MVNRKGSYIICSFDGKSIYRMPSKIRKHNFCNRSCTKAYLKSEENTSMSKGWHHTAAAKEKIKQASLGRNYSEILTDESRKKMANSARMKIWTIEAREKLRQANLGKKLSNEHKLKIKQNGKYNQDNIMWKGDEATYQAKHMWIYVRKGKPTECVDCGTTEKVEWSNKDHKNSRNEDDYEGRCRPCHRKYDIAHNNYPIFKKANKKK